MGRPEPSVLFVQTFVHPQLDEYVDEVLFADPVVITACEFLEQNATSTSQAVTLSGATLPPSFALEVFVQCEGETRFRRLCQPFLYSHSSSNVLEVEAIVTNHLVVRGSYCSLSMVIYGNTAEDLGQFNIGFDDHSLTNLVNSAQGKLEDLTLALYSTKAMTEEPIWGVKTLSLSAVASDISVDTKQFLHLVVKMLKLPKFGDALQKLVSIVVSTASSFVSCKWGKSKDNEDLPGIINEAKEDLLELYNVCLHESRDVAIQLSSELSFLESEVDSFTSKELVDMLSKYFHFTGNISNFEYPWTSKNTKVIIGLSVVLLLCSGKDSFFHVINGGGMEQILHVLDCGMQNSTTIKLLLLGVVEQATRHSFGCEGFLGWWPREDENVPSGSSKSYSCLLNLLLQKPCHDIASLATYVLHRLRFYEVASRYECAILSILGGLSTSGRITSVTLDMLISAKTQLKQLLKLMNSRGPIEDPSPAASAPITLILGQADGPMSYKATSGLITMSKCSFSNWDVDLHLLTLLKERGFLPLSSALLASPLLHSEVGHAMGLIVDIASSIEAIILTLLFCRSGLIFLLNHPEISTTIIHALKGVADADQEECVTLRYASILISNGFFCDPMEVAMIIQMHLRMVNAIDHLLTSNPQSEEFLWVLWDLCSLSRSDCGRQALLVLTYFPEAIKILIEALHSVKESESATKNSGASPLNLAIFHSASEIFEVIVTDSTASSLGSWIEHAMEFHKALHTSSPGSSRKDAPTRLLEWIDAGVVYQKNGVIGLLRYAAVLVSGGDAHLTLTSILGPDLTDVENVVGDSNGYDANIIENLGKIISEKAFDGVSLRDSSIAQLTTAFRILAYISENKTIASNLYDEGAVAVIYTVLVNSRFMLERSSNSYVYLVDESTECNSTSDLLLERNRERSLVDLLVPCLVLLVTLLQSLKEAKEQHRNTKLMNALLRLHREVSPKLAACASDLSSPSPDSALGFGAICHLVASALACWPVYGWNPGLFSSLLSSVHPTSVLALGSKETCSLLCLLNDLFPEEDLLLWKRGMPLLSPLKKLAVGTLLGAQKERHVNWYLEPAHHEKLVNQLLPHLDKISHIIQHYAISTLVVIQDMLRVFIIRFACKKPQGASILLRPIMTWISACVSDISSLTDTDDYKIYGCLDFLATLLEHPQAKALVLKEGVSKLLIEVLDKCFEDIDSGEKQAGDRRNSAKWCLPVFKCFSSLSSYSPYQKHREKQDSHSVGYLSAEDCSLILPCILQFCQVLPHGKELATCLTAFRELGSCDEGRSALAAVVSDISSIKEQPESFGEDRRDGNDKSFNRLCLVIHPPLLYCWKNLLSLVNSTDSLPDHALEAIGAISSGSLRFCINGTGIEEVKFLFGLPNNLGGTNSYPEENISYIHEMIDLLNSKTATEEQLSNSNMAITLTQVLESTKSLLLLLENPTGSVKVDDITLGEDLPSSSNEIRASSAIHQMVGQSAEKVEDYLSIGGLGEKFQWECPESLPDRLGSLPAKRKMTSVEGGPIRRGRGENPPPEIISQSTFSRGSVSSASPSVGPTRRDTFRQRKPNTSRPPSMHVDDYVARERSVDVVTNSNVIAIQRVGSSSGRPPSIHVDEFMARQRERQNPMATPVGGEAAASSQSKGSGAHPSDMETEKFNKPKQLKTNLDDDLQGIDIVFDGEESETDDRLPFPQLDDNLLQQLGPVIVEQSSPHSIVEVTESDANESSQFSHMGGTPFASTNVDENMPSEFSSRMSVSRPGMPLTQEPNVSLDKRYFEPSDDPKSATPIRNNGQVDSPAANPSSGFPASRTNFQNFYHRNSPQHMGNVPPLAAGSQGLYDQRFLPSQPPLPPTQPPLTVAPMMSQIMDLNPGHSLPFINPMIDAQQQSFSSMYQVQTDYLSAYNSSKKSSSSPGGSARPPPPLPPTPPPFSSSPYNNLSSIKTSIAQSSAYKQPSVGTTELLQTDSRLGGASASGARPPYPLPLAQPMIYNRPGLYGNIPAQQQSENQPSILQNLSGPPSSMQSMHSLVQLQPLQPPQIPRPQVPPKHLRPPIQQLEQGGPSLQSPAHMQLHQLQMLQQPHVSPIPYYQSQQPAELSHAPLQQVQNQSGDGGSQSQQDSGISLHEYFKSPVAIQSLLSDRDKLCQLLEQHPKLMQMLQERMGQL